jgi:RimJ/RimL family protein N-acetyltransferase
MSLNPSLETKRIRFRPYRIEDFPFYLKLWQDPEIIRYIGHGTVRDTDDLKKNYPYWLSKSGLGSGVLLMTLKQTGKPIGHAGLVPQIVDGCTETEVGYWLDKPYWGHGLATEAAHFFCDIGQRVLGYERLISIIQPENERSVRVAKRAGMSFEKATTFKEIPVHIYALHASRETQ